ncbi:MAG: aminotransferase class I/II-fold pyridoxal phosphate-dependent enzyme [Bacteroidales bacterium]|nr:aminotransferase class I/II-fold pyridoxal phosphate-dependent enzyme [Bacteroidales bacterium]
MKKRKKFETISVRTQVKRSSQKEHSVPIFATSSFVFDNAEEARAVFADEKGGNIYSRYSNPNNDEFIEKLCLMEKTEDGESTATGMAAIFLALTSHLKAGDHIVASRSLFSSTHQIITNILPRWGITHTYVDIRKNPEWEKAIMPQTRLLFTETPSNPGLDLCDLEFVGKLAKKHNCLFVVDNCFATPYLQTPADFGANLICHSATKFIDGQGRTLGGAIVGPKNIIKDVRFMARQTGPSLSPFNAWILSKSLETLAVRMEKHCSNAAVLATYLDKSDDTEIVKYPFLSSHPQVKLARKQMRYGGALVTFELEGGMKRCIRFLDKLSMISLTSNLGDTRTTATHPASTTHSKLSEEERKAVGITDGLIRISVGLEHIDDIIEDIQQAIERSKKA